MNNSKQRNLILSIVNNSNSHPSAMDIYNEARKTINNISLGTVYRNLNLLVILKQIKVIKGKDEFLRYDKMLKHNHFICDNCCKIYDIFDSYAISNEIDGNVILDYEIKYTGICKKCIQDKNLGGKNNGTKGK